ncbi:MAG: archaeosortase/exosortase family protein [Opitutaceae bacterium]
MPIRQKIAESLSQKIKTTDFWFHCVLYACLGASLMPITLWVAHNTESQSRLFNALIILLFACVMLIRFGHVEIIKPLQLNRTALRYLWGAYGLLLLSILAQFFAPLQEGLLATVISLLAIPAYCFALGSFILFVFGEGTKRVTKTATITLCAFLLLSIFMEPLDWPLRTLAGKWSGAALATIGQTVEIGLQKLTESGAPNLILLVNGHPFNVAAECNGFGVILTSLLLALLLAIYRRLSIFDTALNLIAGIILGFIFNTLRIVIIVLLAPSLMSHYHLMHEIVGFITYWGCLILVWRLLNGPVNDEPLMPTSQ